MFSQRSKNRGLLAGLLLAALLLPALPAQAKAVPKANTLRIGWASRTVCTSGPHYISGQFYLRRSTGILDPITTTALVMEDRGELVVFVSVDTTSIHKVLLQEVREGVKKAMPGFPVHKISINATHTHTAPNHGLNSPRIRKIAPNAEPNNGDLFTVPTSLTLITGDQYRPTLVKNMVEMIREAYEKRAPGGIAYGYGYATVGQQRRVIYFDDVSKRPGQESNATDRVHGRAVMYGNTNDPKFSRFEGSSDPFIYLLYTVDTKGKLTGALINVPCPSQNSEAISMLSASFWHETKEMIRKKYGNIHFITQSGASGDLSPRVLYNKKTQNRRFKLKYPGPYTYHEEPMRKDIAERITNAFTEVYSWAKRDIRYSIRLKHDVRTIHLAKRLITEKDCEDAKKNLKKLESVKFIKEGKDPLHALVQNSRLVSNRGRWRGLINRYEQQKTSKTIPMELHVIAMDELAFTTCRFELYQDFQHRIQARSPFVQTVLVQLCADPAGSGSYLATEHAVSNQGYGATRFSNQVSWQGGNQLVEETLKVLNELVEKKKK